MVTHEYAASHAGYWPLHCHMNYHLAAGMLLLIRYQESSLPAAAGKAGAGTPGNSRVCEGMAEYARRLRRETRLQMAAVVALVLVVVGAAWSVVVLVERVRDKAYASQMLQDASPNRALDVKSRVVHIHACTCHACTPTVATRTRMHTHALHATRTHTCHACTRGVNEQYHIFRAPLAYLC